MKDFSLAAARLNPRIRRVWKYVVFEHNDQPEQLLRAQELAIQAKVTEMRFVLTQSGPQSWDVTHESHIPRLDRKLNVVVDTVNSRIQVKQFTAALTDLSSAITSSDADRAAQSATFFVNMLNRLIRLFLIRTISHGECRPSSMRIGDLSDIRQLADRRLELVPRRCN
jgi:hypothetical protein